MKISFFSKDFPTLSQTFFDNQANSVSNICSEVNVFSLHDLNKRGILNNKVNCISIAPKTNNEFLIAFLTLFYYLFLFLKGEKRHVRTLGDKFLKSKQRLSILYMLFFGKKIKSDFLVSHFGDSAHFIFKLKELGIYKGQVGVVFHAHEITKYTYLKKYKRVYEECFLYSDKVFPISNLWREKLIGMGCSPEKISVIRMGVDINLYPYSPKKLNKESVLKFIQVGRLTEKKGIFDTINAFNKLRGKFSFSLDIVGDGELFDEARSLVRKLNLEEIVIFHGAQSNAIVKEMLKESDVYLLPSKRANNGDMEGIPVALMEAMATGLPVISTYHSGIPELITNLESGLLVEENNAEQLADAILNIYEMGEKEFGSMLMNARERICSDFNIDVEAEKLVNIIKLSLLTP